MNAPTAFWAMGLLNNLPFVIMLACAKSISEGGTALVFISNTLPGLLTKLSAPYWFDKVSYNKRIAACSLLMGSSFAIVAFFTTAQSISMREMKMYNNNINMNNNNDAGGSFGSSAGAGLDFYLIMQLFGVALCSAAGSLGEASLLALSGKTDSILARERQRQQQDGESSATYQGLSVDDETAEEAKEPASICITTFSSGTGLAGVVGFAFVILLRDGLRISMSGTLLCAIIIGPSYWFVYINGLSIYANADLSEPSINETEEVLICSSSACSEGDEGNSYSVDEDLNTSRSHLSIDASSDDFQENPILDNTPDHDVSGAMNETHVSSDSTVGMLSMRGRLELTLSLWPYMIPLFSVYAAEYALQSGVWTAIGFPVDDQSARDSFYMKSNWTYQAGVFISRSTGTLFNVTLSFLWLMPMLQVLNLVFFYLIAATEFWYDYSLLLPCFYVGLLGGAVYVHGYKRINKDVPIEKREFAMSAASVADDSGVLLADLAGLFIQSCLYKIHGVNGAIVTCPV